MFEREDTYVSIQLRENTNSGLDIELNFFGKDGTSTRLWIVVIGQIEFEVVSENGSRPNTSTTARCF